VDEVIGHAQVFGETDGGDDDQPGTAIATP
jgi:hypothetical protein